MSSVDSPSVSEFRELEESVREQVLWELAQKLEFEAWENFLFEHIEACYSEDTAAMIDDEDPKVVDSAMGALMQLAKPRFEDFMARWTQIDVVAHEQERSAREEYSQAMIHWQSAEITRLTAIAQATAEPILPARMN